MLKGLQMPGLAFKFDADSDSYRVCRGVHTADLPPTSTGSLLTTFTILATHIRRIQTFCDVVVFTSAACDSTNTDQDGNKNEDNKLKELPTVAAFAAAVARQVVAIRGQLIILETSASSQNSDTSSLNTINLLSLRLKLALMNRQVGALHAVVKQCYWRGTTPCTAAVLLDTLYSVLETHLMRSGEHSGAVSAMLAEIYSATWQPMNDALECWLSTGSLIDAPPEFYIVDSSGTSSTAAKNEKVDNNIFWSDRYQLQRWSEEKYEKKEGKEGERTNVDRISKIRVAAPALIAPLAESLLHAGLAIVGLTSPTLFSSSGTQQQQQTSWSATTTTYGDEAPISLHAEFVQSLLTMVQNRKQDRKSVV